MLKKTIVIILSFIILSLSCFAVSADEVDYSLDLGNNIITLRGGVLRTDGETYEASKGVFTEEKILACGYVVNSTNAKWYVCYADFMFSGYNYGELTVTLTIDTGFPYEPQGWIYSNGIELDNYSYIVKDNSFIFTINGNIPSRFEISATYGDVVPVDIGGSNYIVTLYSDFNFNPDYSAINQGVINNQNQNTDEIVSNQNQNTQDIIDNQNQLQQNEKDEADSSGNDGINSIVGGIENKGEGFFASMGNLISVMSYNGTDCKWNLPPITLPKIDGVMDSITLTDNLEIDFEYWIAQIPTSIMRVVQAISTIALILFCVKELYSVLSYVFTLRGG